MKTKKIAFYILIIIIIAYENILVRVKFVDLAKMKQKVRIFKDLNKFIEYVIVISK